MGSMFRTKLSAGKLATSIQCESPGDFSNSQMSA